MLDLQDSSRNRAKELLIEFILRHAKLEECKNPFILESKIGIYFKDSSWNLVQEVYDLPISKQTHLKYNITLNFQHQNLTVELNYDSMTNNNTPKNGFKDVENKCATLIEILKPSEVAARECSFVIPASHGSIKNGCMDTNSQNKSKFRINVEYKHNNVTNHEGSYEVQYFVDDALGNKDSFCKSFLWIVNQMVMFISNLCVSCGGCYFSDYQDNGELKLITLCNEFCASDD